MRDKLEEKAFETLISTLRYATTKPHCFLLNDSL